MLKFFRRIRQNLLSESKFSKYLVYAVGEILLVMIGILLALQVNNWNEQNKSKKEEIVYLQNFLNDLTIDVKRFDLSIAIMQKAKNSITFLLDYMEQDLPWNDSLKYHFGNTTGNWTGEISLNTYETVKSKEWGIISNPQLRKDLSDYYNWMINTVNITRMHYTDALLNMSENVLPTRFNAFWDSNYEEWKKINTYEGNTFDPLKLVVYAIPNNFEDLKKDAEYLYSLRSLRNKYNFYRELQDENAKLVAEKLIKDINIELRRLQD